MKHWTCKAGNHEGCNGKVLDGNIMTGLKGIKDCKCNCHPKSLLHAIWERHPLVKPSLDEIIAKRESRETNGL